MPVFMVAKSAIINRFNDFNILIKGIWSSSHLEIKELLFICMYKYNYNNNIEGMHNKLAHN